MIRLLLNGGGTCVQTAPTHIGFGALEMWKEHREERDA